MIQRLKHNLRFWRADLPVALFLFTIAVAATGFGTLLFGLSGGVGGFLATLGMIQLLDMIP